MAQRERKTKRLIEAEEQLIGRCERVDWLRLVGLVSLHGNTSDAMDLRSLVNAYDEVVEAHGEYLAAQAGKQSEKNDDA